MSKEDRDAILQAAAKTLAWELYAAAGYGRLRTRINVERFDRELRSAVREWSAAHKNLKERKENDCEYDPNRTSLLETGGHLLRQARS